VAPYTGSAVPKYDFGATAVLASRLLRAPSRVLCLHAGVDRNIEHRDGNGRRAHRARGRHMSQVRLRTIEGRVHRFDRSRGQRAYTLGFRFTERFRQLWARRGKVTETAARAGDQVDRFTAHRLSHQPVVLRALLSRGIAQRAYDLFELSVHARSHFDGRLARELTLRHGGARAEP
jgi:hypothetical protein